MDSKILIIAVVVVVAAAGAGGAYFLMSGNSNSSSTVDSVNIEDYADFDALVLGNANGDTKIDADDVTLINEIVNGTKKFEDYPLADANRDGKVTNDDATFTQSIIDGTATSVNVIDCRGRVINTPYPLDSMFFEGRVNGREVANVLELQNQMVALATSTIYAEVLDQELVDKIYDKDKNPTGTITQVSTDASDSDFTTLSQLSFKAAIVEESAQSQYASDESIAKIKDFGAPTLIFNFDNTSGSIQSVATIGVLVKNTDAATSYCTYMDTILSTINEAIADYTADTKKTCMTVTMSNSVSGTESDYYDASQVAGGVQIADWSASTKKFDPTKGDTWMYEEKYNADYLLHFKSQKFDVSVSENVKTATNYAQYFSETYTFKEGGYYLLNGVIPLPARLAYMAEIMYPTDINSGWGDTIFQQFVTNYANNAFTVTDYIFYWDVTNLLDYTEPTTMTLTNKFLSDGTLTLGLNNATTITMTTNGNVYLPVITNSNESVATVSFTVNDDHTGGTLALQAGATVGTTTLTITSGSATQTITVNISDIAATSIEFPSSAITIGLANPQTLSYVLTPANANLETFGLTSSDTSVVTLENGIITGLKAGTSTLTVTYGSLSDTCVVTVEDVTATGVTWTSGMGSSGTYTVCRGTTTYNYSFGFTVAPTNASLDDVTVVCSNTSIIQIDSTTMLDGVLTVNVTRIDESTKELVTITVSVDGQEAVANLRCNGWKPA